MPVVLIFKPPLCLCACGRMAAIAGCVLPEFIECTRYSLAGGIYSIISSTARDFGLTNDERRRLMGMKSTYALDAKLTLPNLERDGGFINLWISAHAIH
jgi:hypothetical protein